MFTSDFVSRPNQDPAIVAMCLNLTEPYFSGWNDTEMHVAEVETYEEFKKCNTDNAVAVPHQHASSSTELPFLQGIEREHQVKGFVVWPRKEDDSRFFISKNQTNCQNGLRVQIQWN